MEGTIKWFNTQKNYGFIKGDDGQDYLVHHTALSEGTHLKENDLVTSDPIETDRRKQAQNIKLVKNQ